MVPPSSLQQKPPPEVQYAQAMVQIKKQEADAKTAMVGVKQQEIAAKMQEGQGAQGAQGPTIEDQLKMADLQVKKQELQDKQQDSMMDAINRKRDRESRERFARELTVFVRHQTLFRAYHEDMLPLPALSLMDCRQSQHRIFVAMLVARVFCGLASVC